MNWRYIFGGRKRDAEIDEEIASHLRMAIQDRVERGESPQDAGYAARREFGNALLVIETTREVWVWTALEQLRQDFRFALRILTKSPAFSAAAVTLVALGIGVDTTIFSMINTILNKPAPGVQARGLVSFGLMINGQPDEPEHSYPNYLDYARQSKTMRSILGWGFERFALVLPNGTYALFGMPVTANYFDTAGVHLVRGRTFTDEEAGAGSSGLAAVITYRLWQNQFEGAEDVIGRPVVLNGHAATIVGVAPPRFRGTHFAGYPDIWVPLVSYSRIRGKEKDLNDRSSPSLGIVGRLAPGVSLSEAQAEFDTISKRLQAAYPEADKNKTVVLAPYTATAFGPNSRARTRMFMAILNAVALLTLLVICANVANLMLARAVARQREMAVRRSMGASRSRILRMLAAEGLVLSLAALAAAWCFALWACRSIVGLLPPANQGFRLEPDFTPDWRVLVYALALAVLGAVAFTIAPALRAWRQELLPWLKAGEHSVAQGRSALSNVLVVAQIALCALLLTSAGLAGRSTFLLGGADLHFAKDHLLLVTVNTNGATTGKEETIDLLERLRQRLRAIPGIQSASYSWSVPPNAWWSGPVQAAGSARSVPCDGNYVGPDYLQALGVPDVVGRGISVQDMTAARKVAVINQNLAETLWPHQPAVGQTLLMGPEKQSVEVIGVAPNGAFSGIERDVRSNFAFLPERLNAEKSGERTFHLRYTGNLKTVAPAVRAAIREIAARVPVSYMRTMETQLEDETAPAVMVTSLLGMFSTGALIVAAIGLYAVVAFSTAKRKRDFGVRMALGASSQQILNGVLKEGLWLTAAGLAIGLALSAAAGRAFRGFLYGVSPMDGLTYLGAMSLLAAVSLFACYIPARRAAATNPVEALRQE